MAETPSQEPVTATENGPVNVEVDASVPFPSIVIHQKLITHLQRMRMTRHTAMTCT